MYIRRKRYGLRKRRIYRKKKQTVAKLASQVRSIIRRNKRDDEYIQLGQFNNNDSMSSSPTVVNLCNYNGMAGIFGTSSGDRFDNKIIHQSMGMDLRVTLENGILSEESTIQFTAFLVSLRDNIGSVFNPATGTLTFTNTRTHYQQTGGLCLLNKKMFKIHKMKRFVLTNYDAQLGQSAAQSQYGTDCRWYWKVAPRSVIQAPSDSWTDLQSAQDPSKQYYLLIFHDNSVADLESPTFSANIVHTLKKCN